MVIPHIPFRLGQIHHNGRATVFTIKPSPYRTLLRERRGQYTPYLYHYGHYKELCSAASPLRVIPSPPYCLDFRFHFILHTGVDLSTRIWCVKSQTNNTCCSSSRGASRGSSTRSPQKRQQQQLLNNRIGEGSSWLLRRPTLGRSRLCVRDTPDRWRRWPTVPRLQMGYS